MRDCARATWGQSHQWHEQRAKAAGREAAWSLHRRWLCAADEVSVPHVLDAVARLVDRHDGLRTTLHLSSDRMLFQHVARSGTPRVDVIDDAVTLARAVDELITTPYDLAREHQARFLLFAPGGRLVEEVIFGSNHVAVDHRSMEILMAELRSLVLGRPLPALRLRPVDIAAAEAGERAARRSARAARRWALLAAKAPARPFASGSVTSRDRRTSTFELVSAGLAPALRRAARDHQVSESAVVLAAYCALLAPYAQTDTFFFQVYCANARIPELADAAASLVQPSPVLIELSAATTLPDLVRATDIQLLAAYLHGSYDPTSVLGLAPHAVDGGPVSPLERTFNFVDLRGDTPAAASRPDRALPRADVVELARGHGGSEQFLRVVRARSTCTLQLLVDTSCVPRTSVPDLLRATETAILGLATGCAPAR